MYFLNGYGTLTTAFDCAENLCSRLRSECLPTRPSEHDKKGADCEKDRGKEPRPSARPTAHPFFERLLAEQFAGLRRQSFQAVENGQGSLVFRVLNKCDEHHVRRGVNPGQGRSLE